MNNTEVTSLQGINVRTIYKQGSVILTVVSSLFMSITILFGNVAEDYSSAISYFLYGSVSLIVPIATVLMLVAIGLCNSRATLNILMTIPITLFFSAAVVMFLIPALIMWMSSAGILVIINVTLFLLYKAYYTSINLYGFPYDIASAFWAICILYLLSFIPLDRPTALLVLFPIINIITDRIFSESRKRQKKLFEHLILP